MHHPTTLQQGGVDYRLPIRLILAENPTRTWMISNIKMGRIQSLQCAAMHWDGLGAGTLECGWGVWGLLRRQVFCIAVSHDLSFPSKPHLSPSAPSSRQMRGPPTSPGPSCAAHLHHPRVALRGELSLQTTPPANGHSPRPSAAWTRSRRPSGPCNDSHIPQDIRCTLTVLHAKQMEVGDSGNWRGCTQVWRV